MNTPPSRIRIAVAILLLFSFACPNPADARLFGKRPKEVHQEEKTFGAFFRKPSYDLPYVGWEFPREEVKKTPFFIPDPKPTHAEQQLLTVIRDRAERIASFRLPYMFGGDHPTEGGLDCSGTMKFMLGDVGFSDMPRTSYHQYEWLKKHKTFHHSKSIPEKAGGRKGIRAGDLIFWGGTYNSGHKVSHVMIYLGQSPDGTHYMFGARGKKMKGLFGSGVDIFRLDSGYQKNLIGYGSLPGVS